MINPNLDASNPVLLGILDANGDGHAVVADGYGYDTGTLYHHLNLGWGGACTAWYIPSNIDTSCYTFNTVTDCIYNVYTSSSGEIMSGQVTDSTGNPIPGQA